MKIDLDRGRRYAAWGLIAILMAAARGGLFAETELSSREGMDRRDAASLGAIQTPDTVIQEWPEPPRSLARLMIAQYGQPDRFGENALAWDDNGIWKRSVVHRRAWPRSAKARDKDFLEQSVVYHVPPDKQAELKAFDNRVEFDAVTGRLSSRSESESMNYLALNLANEVIVGVRGAAEARELYRKTRRLAQSGKSSPYLEGLLFHPSPTPEDLRP
ncbi:MAG: hypothetical protein HYZ74_07030 [Elusimicrobia bacterium]|nr:hypothetical protein [Elusimicrobiota bacterium]